MNSLTDLGQVSVARCRNTSILGCIATTGESEQCFVRAADWTHNLTQFYAPIFHSSSHPYPSRSDLQPPTRQACNTGAKPDPVGVERQTCPVDVVEHRRMAAMPKMHTTKLKKQMVTNVLPVGVLWTLTVSQTLTSLTGPFGTCPGSKKKGKKKVLN